MRGDPVFVDTFQWIAEINPRDEWHEACIRARQRVDNRTLVTTEEVLTEVLTFFAGLGNHMRTAAAETVRAIQEDPSVRVVPQSHNSFINGLDLYTRRPDKEYSLTDCTSMQTMRERGLVDVLTHDHHFNQEGFNVLVL